MKFTAHCVRSGNWWAITVPEIKGVFTQVRRLDQAEAMARDAIALMLDIAPDSFDVQVVPEIPDEVVRARQARESLRQAERSAEKATRSAAETLLAQGYTVRDVGELLGISPQRVSQISHSRKAEKPHRSAA